MGTVVERTPYDVWVNISQFLPRDVVRTFYDVNRSFLRIATVARWKVLKVAKCDKHTKWILKNLRHVLNVDGRGSLVREVTIEPWLVQPSLKPSHKRGASIWGFICGLFDSKYAERELNRRVQKRLKKDILRVTNAISALPHLNKYTLEWNDHRRYHPEMYRAFLTPVLKVDRIWLNLRTLSLNVPVEILPSIVPISLPQLENLEVHLCTKKKPKQEIDDIFDSFTVFVNNLFESLETLSISSRAPSQFLVLDRFFSNLETFPRLREFGLTIPRDGAHLSSSHGVVKFLSKHLQTLKALRLSVSTNRSATLVAAPNPQSKDWLPDILASLDKPYPCLHGLQVDLRPFDGNLTPLLDFISFHSLDTLKLTGVPLTYQEVVRTLNALGVDDHPIKKIHLKLEHLDPAILELFATRLQKLNVLEVVFCEVKATTEYLMKAGRHGNTARVKFQLFEEEFRTKPLPFMSWQLGTLGLLQEFAANSCVGQLFKLFADCIPAVQNHIDMTPEPRKRY
ncbi:hypothetical protein H0H92_002848 [Tricholoma furcatifolium]|nr:hypothetical protein H0H92_002848 [Tricholoma furcatifolium]